MQTLSCGSPLVTREGMTIRELDKVEVALPTPKSEWASGGIKTHPFQTQQFLEVRDLHQTDHDKCADLENQPASASKFTTYSNPDCAPKFTMYSNPAFDTESPTKPSCIPVDSNGQKLCPTPKRTRSSASPRAFKLRLCRATSVQPLSPTVRKYQVKRVLKDSNGQRTQETPKVSKQCSTPRERSTAYAISGSENQTPRAVFQNSLNEPPAFSGAEMRSATGSKVKKRTRGEDDAALGKDMSRATRSKTGAERIATFLMSPAARVRPDGRKEEYRLGVSDALVKQFTERKEAMQKSCQCDTRKPCLGCNDSMLEESSLNLNSSKPPVSRQLHAIQESPSSRVRMQTPGLGRSTLLRSPLVTSTKKQGEMKTPASRTGILIPPGSAKKNLSVLLEAQK